MGTVTLTFTGMGGYTGSFSKQYKITPYDIKANAEGRFTDATPTISATYTEGGAKPDVTVKFNGTKLEKDKDYTLSYANNTKVYDGTNAKQKKPTITIKGIGNFKGSVTCKADFKIKQCAMNNSSYTIRVNDMLYKKGTKDGSYKATVNVVAPNGSKLSLNKDYTVKYYYVSNYDGEIQTKENYIYNYLYGEGKTSYKIKAEVKGKGNYAESGTVSTYYYVTKQTINNAKITLNTKTMTYDGTAKKLDYKDVTVTVGKDVLTSKDFEFVEYVNNTNVGTASVVIKGKGNYSGRQKVTFKIVQKKA